MRSRRDAHREYYIFCGLYFASGVRLPCSLTNQNSGHNFFIFLLPQARKMPAENKISHMCDFAVVRSNIIVYPRNSETTHMVYFIPSGLSLAVEVKDHARAFFKHALEDWRIFQKTVVFRK